MSENDNLHEDHDSDAQDIHLEGVSAESRKEIRQTIDDQVAAFLAAGGQIQQIDANVTADPPQKPTSNYGSRPI